jgi:hypothetical protein
MDAIGSSKDASLKRKLSIENGDIELQKKRLKTSDVKNDAKIDEKGTK